MVAARYGHVEVADELIRAGARLDVRGFHGWTALHVAFRHGQTGVACSLIDAGANMNMVDNDHIKAREACCRRRGWGIVSQICRHGLVSAKSV